MPFFKEFQAQSMAYLSPVMLAIAVLGVASGLPLALTGATLTAWLTDAEISLTHIGLFAAVAMPYALKFLWSPLVDAFDIPILTPKLGRRRAWLLTTQAALVAALAGISLVDPNANPEQMVFFALAISTASATQDIVFDAWRIERLTPERYAHGVAMVTVGYRVGMLIAGGGALILAEHYGWAATYQAMAACMGLAMAITLSVKEPEGEIKQESRAGKRLAHAIIGPFKSFMQERGWWVILLFVLLYKMGDAFLGVMTMPFLLSAIEFTKSEVAYVVKLYGFAATLGGTFIGAWLVNKLGLIRVLWIAGIFHALTNGMFLVQEQVGHDLGVLTLGISLENFTGGISSAAFLSYISGLCKREFTATHYALLSSLAALGRTVLSTPAGWFAESFGWSMFFIVSIALAFPSLALLWWMERKRG